MAQVNINILTTGLFIAVMIPQANSEPVNVALRKPIKGIYTCGALGRESYSTSADALLSVAQRPRRYCEDYRSVDFSDSSSLPASMQAPKLMVDGDLGTFWQTVSRNKVYMYGADLASEKSQKLEARIELDLLQVGSFNSLHLELFS